MIIHISNYVASWERSPFAGLDREAWGVTSEAPQIVAAALKNLSDDYIVQRDLAIHRTAVVEEGAAIKGPALIGARCFVSSSALLRGGIFLDEDCIVGPAVELKTTLMFRGSKVAHLSFVGDSILGEDVNLEAGSIVANYRNELANKRILIAMAGQVIDTGVDKFGALIGDGSRIGANAVIAPGALLKPNSRVPRLGLVDQSPRAQGLPT
jgi:bifunctional N-acetylglucosamine-1-phosphate-uridyltransferase/glucosamine-1-phosphate-acetyltransferase GlmU-like protein